MKKRVTRNFKKSEKKQKGGNEKIQKDQKRQQRKHEIKA